jgi:hypothetical protein
MVIFFSANAIYYWTVWVTYWKLRNKSVSVIFEIFAAVTSKITVFWDMTPCSLLGRYPCFGRKLLPQFSWKNNGSHLQNYKVLYPCRQKSSTLLNLRVLLFFFQCWLSTLYIFITILYQQLTLWSVKWEDDSGWEGGTESTINIWISQYVTHEKRPQTSFRGSVCGLYYFFFLVGWDWVYSALRQLSAYCTRPGW